MTDSCRIEIKLKPGAKRNSLCVADNGTVTAAVTSPPVDGKANKHLIKLIAKAVGVPKSNCQIIQGKTSRNKVLAIEGKNENEVRECLIR